MLADSADQPARRCGFESTLGILRGVLNDILTHVATPSVSSEPQVPQASPQPPLSGINRRRPKRPYLPSR